MFFKLTFFIRLLMRLAMLCFSLSTFWVLNWARRSLQILCSTYACFLSFNLPCNTMRVKLSSLPFYKWASQGLEKINDLAKKWQPVSGRGRIWNSLHVTPSEELVISYEGKADTLRGTLTISPKALKSGSKNEGLSQLLLLVKPLE